VIRIGIRGHFFHFKELPPSSLGIEVAPFSIFAKMFIPNSIPPMIPISISRSVPKE